jgi:hypothetical protein
MGRRVRALLCLLLAACVAGLSGCERRQDAEAERAAEPLTPGETVRRLTGHLFENDL